MKRYLPPPLAAALRNPLRAHILAQVGSGPCGPREIAARSGEPLPKIVYHLRVLREFGCVEPMVDGSGGPAEERVYRKAEREPA